KKIINKNYTKALVRHNITIKDMPTNIDRDTFRFIERYAEVNGGHAPSYAAVADEVMGFEYIPEVSDSFTWLADRVKSFSAKKRIINLFETGEFERKL